MKLSIIILALGAALGLWQWQSLAKLQKREVLLKEELVLLQTKAQGEGAEPPAGKAAKAKAELADAKPKFQTASFMAMIREIVAKGSDSRPDQQQVVSLMEQLGAATPAQLKDLLREIEKSDLPNELKREFPMVIAMRMASAEPEFAAETALGAQPLALGQIMKTWMSQDQEAAKAWLAKAEKEGRLTQENLAQLPDLKASLVVSDLAKNPATAREAMADFGPAQRTTTIRESMAKMSPANQVRFLKEMANEVEVEVAVSALAQRSDFSTAREIVTKAELTGEKFTRAALTLASENIGPDTPERVAWFLQNAQGQERERGLQRIMTNWTEMDYNGAASWLKDLPPSADRDRAVSSFSSRVAVKEPASAADWASSIQDSPTREQALRVVWEQWQKKAPEEAASYFASKGWAAPN